MTNAALLPNIRDENIKRLLYALVLSIALHAGLIVVGQQKPSIEISSPLILQVQLVAKKESLQSKPKVTDVAKPVNSNQKPASSKKSRNNILYLTEDKLDVRPEPVQEIVPSYPLEALARNMGANIKLIVFIDEEGNVVKAMPASNQEMNVFVESALIAIRQTRFTPAQVNGRAVPAVLTPVIRFRPP